MSLFGSDPSKPFRDEIDSFAAEFTALRTAHDNRLSRSKLYRDEIESTRKIDQVASPAQTSDYGRSPRRNQAADYQRNKFRFPLGQALTVKHAYRIAGRMPDVVVDRRQETQAERYRSDTMEKVWWAIVYDSDGEVAFADAAWDSSQIGSSAFEVYPSKAGGPPCFRALDAATCLPVLGVDDPHDFQRFYRWWRVPYGAFIETYRNATFREVPVDVDEVEFDNDERMVTLVECCSKQKRIRFTLGGSGKGEKKNVALEEWDHGYGYVPNVIIPNLGPYRKVFGWADYEFVREIIRYIPQLFGREADIIQMVANGAMMMKGTKLSPAQVKRLLAEGGVIPVGRDGDLVPVQVPDVPQFAIDHHNRAFDLMERLGFAPPAAWGAIGASSGSDRGLQLQPMVELTSMKQKNWSAGLSRLAGYAFRMVESKMVGSHTFKGTYPTGNGQQAFSLILGADLDSLSQVDEMSGAPVGDYPRTPKDLFAGDYKVRFLFADRIDYDDPAYVASELNKFAQNVQSATTTLEHLGIESPEDEMKLIQQEAEAYPWLRPNMLKMMEMAQQDASAQGENDGSQNAPTGGEAMTGAMDTMTSPDGQALDTDAMSGALPGGGNGQLYGGA